MNDLCLHLFPTLIKLVTHTVELDEAKLMTGEEVKQCLSVFSYLYSMLLLLNA